MSLISSVRIWCLVGGLWAPLGLTQCKTSAGHYKNVQYDPATLNTPSGHGMQKKDYPFDDDGRYRKDWVRNKATGKTRSASKLSPSEVAQTTASTAASASTEVSAAVESASSDLAYYGPSAADSAVQTSVESFSESANTVVSAGQSVVSSAPRYHEVVSGDTLYSLSQRYGTSVEALQRANGLSGNSIITGQSLRLP